MERTHLEKAMQEIQDEIDLAKKQETAGLKHASAALQRQQALSDAKYIVGRINDQLLADKPTLASLANKDGGF